MSRSLDKETAAQLKAQDPKPVYHDISSVLSNLPGSQLLEIELLGKSLPLEPGVNFLQDGAAVAIPKLRLVQAFLVARRILQKHLESSPKSISSDVLAATAVLLLMDPEHLTAANVRKRAVIMIMEDGDQVELVLKKDKQFVDSLLTARLHRHTKSPNLWSHRRWLLNICKAHGVVLDVRHDITQVVMVAGDRHPRNYVAWNHARFLLDMDSRLAASIAADIKEFCLRHHTDTSGWNFLLCAIGRIDDEHTRLRTCSTLVADILEVVESFRWANESVWVFLRTIMAAEGVRGQQFESFIAINHKISSLMSEDNPHQRLLGRAQRWCDKYRVAGCLGPEGQRQLESPQA
ncbi:Uu.00g072020.m01.CDS01 [Anthostomella pinea]|uniref:Uu.00g072020.m01.CDS01 n=1 Tax=Anthostomella pinea TaxID=933095 RepID=A0AAI8VUZ3_9PEZI|nr:Uu.00g072020.m01.CDS01 [Anthostomella pinea]